MLPLKCPWKQHINDPEQNKWRPGKIGKANIDLFALLVDDCDNDQKIYTDFSDIIEYAESANTPLQRSQNELWGNYSERTDTLSAMDPEGQAAVESIGIDLLENCFPFITAPQMAEVSEALDRGIDIRPKVYDKILKEHILLDTGAQVSVWPKTYFKHPELNNLELKSVNKSKISTYGTAQKSVQINKKVYKKKVIIADVEKPILGQDFIALYRLDQVWEGDELYLVDKKTKNRSRLYIGPVEKGTPLNLAPIESTDELGPNIDEIQAQYSFKQWSQICN